MRPTGSATCAPSKRESAGSAPRFSNGFPRGKAHDKSQQPVSTPTISNWRPLSAQDLIRADDALRSIGAYAFRNKRYGVLSQGEKQRVMIAPSAGHQTRPTHSRRALRRSRPRRPGAIESTTSIDCVPKSNGPTLILVSHHVEEIPAQGTHGLLAEGRTSAGSRPLERSTNGRLLSELYDHPCKVGSSNGRLLLHGR